MIYWKFKYSRTQRALAVGVSVEEKSAATTVIDEKISIVKYIVATKLTEAKSKEQEQTKKEQKQKLLKIIAEKEDSNLQSKSIGELTAMLNNM